MDANTEGLHRPRQEYMPQSRHDGETYEIARYGGPMPTHWEWQYPNISYDMLGLDCHTTSLYDSGHITSMVDELNLQNKPMIEWTGSAEPGFHSQWSTLCAPGPPPTMVFPPSAFHTCCLATYPREVYDYLEPTSAGMRESTPEYVRFGEEASTSFKAGAPANGFLPGHASRSHSVQFPLPLHGSVGRPIANTYDAVGSDQFEVADVAWPLLSGPTLSTCMPESQCCVLDSGLTKDRHQSSVSVRKRRMPNDLYTPVEIEGFGIDRVGKCTLCSPPRWLKIKNSEYWYDKMFRHGINAATGEAFKPPAEVRIAASQGTSPRKKVRAAHMAEGRCHNCGMWLPLGKMKDGRYLGVAWIRHAYKCEKESRTPMSSAQAACSTHGAVRMSKPTPSHRRQYSAPAGPVNMRLAVPSTAENFSSHPINTWPLRYAADLAGQK